MKPLRRLVLAALCAGVILQPTIAAAQTYPNKPIKIVIPYAPGGGTDIVVRAIAPTVERILGQSLIVENKPGGNSMIGTEIAIRAEPDGYTFLAVDSALLINPGLFKSKMRYDTVQKLEGVTMMATGPVLFVGRADLPASNVKEVVAQSKASGKPWTFGSGGAGTSVHLAGELFKLESGANLSHVPYKGTSPAVTDVLGGHVDTIFGGISSGRQHVESGRLKGLAVTGKKRHPALPNVPTFAEFGYDVDANSYWGLYAPAGVPLAAREAVSRAFAHALHQPDAVKRLSDLGYTPIGNTPQEHTKQFRDMVNQWIALVDKMKIQAD